MNVDMKGLMQLQADAGMKWGAFQLAQAHALSVHSGYSEANAAWQKAVDAYEKVQAKATGIVNDLASDPTTDQTWFDPTNQKGPVWLRDNAYARLADLAAAKGALLADIAAHWHIHPTDAALNPAAAAAAADDAAKAGPPPWSVGPGLWNPNAATPDAQDGRHPPVDSPPVPESSTPWLALGGIFAAAVVVTRLVLRAR